MRRRKTARRAAGEHIRNNVRPLLRNIPDHFRSILFSECVTKFSRHVSVLLHQEQSYRKTYSSSTGYTVSQPWPYVKHDRAGSTFVLIPKMRIARIHVNIRSYFSLSYVNPYVARGQEPVQLIVSGIPYSYPYMNILIDTYPVSRGHSKARFIIAWEIVSFPGRPRFYID